MTNLPAGVVQALTTDQVVGYLDVSQSLDWDLSRDETDAVMNTRCGWTRIDDYHLEDPQGMFASVGGSRYDTWSITIMHTEWERAVSAELKARREDELAAAISAHTTIPGRRARRDGHMDYCWDFPDGRRVWLDYSFIELLSPTTGRADRFAEQNPEKFASYGEEGEYA